MGISKTRVSTAAAIKSKKALQRGDADNSNILLARGLSARYCGANIPLSSVTSEEMERDLRHMEAFSNACVAYAQQYYIYQNSSVAASEDTSEKGRKATSQPTAAPPMIAMPVRIDPEEEKRLANLRLKIQHCEAQREVLESEYLSLRAHYVYLSQRLKNFRNTVNGRVETLQELTKKRGQLVALQRTRLQISREVLACLHYRQSGGKVPVSSSLAQEGEGEDLVELWTDIDEQFKKAEENCREEGVEPWEALKVPKIPPGVPLLLSQLAKPLGFAAAWSTAGMFGSKPESLCWLEPEFPEASDRSKGLPALREEFQFLRAELDKERGMNRDLQTGIIARRQHNDELVAMMALLRTETEAVVARHNILLESDVAKRAALQLHQQEEEEEAHTRAVAAAAHQTPAAMIPAVDGEAPAVTAVLGTQEGVATTTNGDAGVHSNDATAAAPEDLENDGDDEGGGAIDEEDDGEILEEGGEKRVMEPVENGGSPRQKRRKL